MYVDELMASDDANEGLTAIPDESTTGLEGQVGRLPEVRSWKLER